MLMKCELYDTLQVRFCEVPPPKVDLPFTRQSIVRMCQSYLLEKLSPLSLALDPTSHKARKEIRIIIQITKSTRVIRKEEKCRRKRTHGLIRLLPPTHIKNENEIPPSVPKGLQPKASPKQKKKYLSQMEIKKLIL